ncbi:MAG: ABC transporter permease [Candidatus Latescibacteria bacterium]|nr:ABC transporter permease [Candidatus Latescibacterota bacterium]
MFKIYFKTALRILIKSRTYTSINIIGLALGIACCLLIMLYVEDELNYDGFHRQAHRIYRITSEEIHKGMGVTRSATTPARLALTLQDTYPEIKGVVRLYPKSSLVARGVQAEFQEERFFYTDPDFFQVFSFRLLEGNPAEVLKAPFSVVLTESAARRYFGNENAIGQVLNIDRKFDCNITGIVQDPPDNSHIQFDFLASFATAESVDPWIVNWEWPPMYTYLLLHEDHDIAEIRAQMPKFIAQNLPSHVSGRVSFAVQALRRIHLYSHLERELTPNSDIVYVYIFSTIAFFILLIACINFINMTTSRSVQRALEVGMHKVFGAHRNQLVRQFLCESLLVATLACVLALGLVECLLPIFNSVSHKQIGLQDLGYQTVFFVSAGLVVGVGVIAGSYPAFYLSRFTPARAVKGILLTPHSPSAWLRKGLVIFQFAISSILITGTIIIYSQLDFLQHTRLGFDKEQMVIVPLREVEDQKNYRVLKQKWREGPGVISVTGSSGVPTHVGLYEFHIFPNNARDDSLEIFTLTVDKDFVETYNMEILNGRDFSEHHISDAAQAFLVNEAAAEKLGWLHPIGKEMTLRYWRDKWVRKKGRIIGLVKDFHYHSLHRSIEPILFHIDTIEKSYYYAFLSVRISGSDIQNALSFLKRRWKEFNPNRPFEFFFLDDRFDQLYRAEERQAHIIGIFALIAISIACLGLFSLAAFSTEQRTKEVGVRKVLGASGIDIVVLLSKEFTKLVIYANLLAYPIAYYIAEVWLQGFPYRIHLGVSPFLVGGLLTLTIAFVTVAYHAFKAATANPVEALRYE